MFSSILSCKWLRKQLWAWVWLQILWNKLYQRWLLGLFSPSMPWGSTVLYVPHVKWVVFTPIAVRTFVRSFVRTYVRSFVRSSLRSFVRSFLPLFFESFVCSSTHLFFLLFSFVLIHGRSRQIISNEQNVELRFKPRSENTMSFLALQGCSTLFQLTLARGTSYCIWVPPLNWWTFHAIAGQLIQRVLYMSPSLKSSFSVAGMTWSGLIKIRYDL